MTFFPSGRPWLRLKKRKRGKGKAGHFIFLFREQGMKEQEGRGLEEVERTEKVSCSQRTRNFKTWKVKTIAATTCSRRWWEGEKIWSNKGGLCGGREKLVSVRVTFPHRCWDVASLLCCLWENISSLSALLWSTLSLNICQDVIANFWPYEQAMMDLL